MKNKTCHECENCIYPPMCDNTLCPISDENFAEICGGFTQIQKPPKTLFDTITASPEVLAPKLVYWCLEEEFGECIGVYRSTLFDDTTDQYWRTEGEAIAATVKKLKEVCDERQP